jgi:hypothetical protein
LIAAQDTLASGLRGFWPVLDGHLGHARLANRMIYWLRRSSPTWLAQNEPENEGAKVLLSRRVSSLRPIRVLVKYPG